MPRARRADGLLIAVDNRSCTSGQCIANQFFTPTLSGAFEDYRYDALGRRVEERTRTDSICTGATCVSSLMRVVFDGNAIAAEIRGPGRAVPFTLPTGTGTAPAETLTVATVYDSGGLVRRVTRTATPDSTVGSLVTRMGYDPAGRKVVDTATDNATETYAYDAAGHVIVHNTRNGGIVAWDYDALGQLMNRQIGATITPAITCGSCGTATRSPQRSAGPAVMASRSTVWSRDLGTVRSTARWTT